MGKPYSVEMAQLAETYSWARHIPVAPLVTAINASGPFPLLTLGSGGSLTAADIAVTLHQYHTGQIAKAVTPLELVRSTIDWRHAAVLVLSAEGRNADVIGTVNHILMREPCCLSVLCMRLGSPLATLTQTYRYVDTVEYDLPSGKDGFLATNSLLACSVILCRAYAEAFSHADCLPQSLDALLRKADDSDKGVGIDDLYQQCSLLWPRSTILVLHGALTHAAAIDLESKFMEAALGNLHIADYRNFAHGRHYWLARQGDTTAILALVAEEDRDIANRTLRLIPTTVPVARIDVPRRGMEASLAALVLVLRIVHLAGMARNADPGRPGVPLFGRKIYRLRAFPKRSVNRTSADTKRVAIERKAGVSIEALTARGDFDIWRRAHTSFVKSLERQSFGSIIFDYDGTICDRASRYTGLDSAVLEHLRRILDAGVVIGIATGRGKSAREDLRRILVENLWPQVFIGYYNGAENGRLDNNAYPDAEALPCPALAPIVQFLQEDPYVSAYTTRTCRHWQITVEPAPQASMSRVWDVVQHIVLAVGQAGVTVVRSSHSVDILAPGVSKRSLIKLIGANTRSLPVLCIGDRGRWPGNDASLLTEPHSLSVDEVSPDLRTCWNIAPPGYRGVQAVLAYLEAVRVADGIVTVVVSEIGRIRS